MFENLIEILKANPRKIVYTEGTDARILSSAARLKKAGFLKPPFITAEGHVVYGTFYSLDDVQIGNSGKAARISCLLQQINLSMTILKK